MCSLAESEKRLLVGIARRSVIAAVEEHAPLESLPGSQVLRKPGGAFVTLHVGSRLRGCIGQLPGHDALVEVVAHCARLAALEDPRFYPVKKEDLAGIEIEISVLSELEDIAPESIVSGRHGLMVSHDGQRGVLLPQVAAQTGWGALRFLEETCVKAGLDPQAWKDPETRIQAFTAEVFSEPAPDAREPGRESYSIST
jgi:AmmeMemoRadiSam system protein A